MKLTPANVAVALVERHGYDWDVAYSAAHAWLHDCLPSATFAQAIAAMQAVRKVPDITDEEALFIQNAYRKVKIGKE